MMVEMKVPSPDKVRNKLPLASMHRILTGCCGIVGFVGYFLLIAFFFLSGALREMKKKPTAALLGARPALVHTRRVYSKFGLKRMCASLDRAFSAVLHNSTASLDSDSTTPLVGRSA
jgi:hypothetical protein